MFSPDLDRHAGGDEMRPLRNSKDSSKAPVDQIISELAIDWTSANGKKLEAILEHRYQLSA